MLFVLTNASAMFQRALDVILSRFKWKMCLVYLDDVISISYLVEKHLRHVEKILHILQSAQVLLKLSKYEFSVQRSHTLTTCLYMDGYKSNPAPSSRQKKLCLLVTNENYAFPSRFAMFIAASFTTSRIWRVHLMRCYEKGLPKFLAASLWNNDFRSIN